MTKYRKGCLISIDDIMYNENDKVDIYFSEEGYVMDCYDNLFHKYFHRLDSSTQSAIMSYLEICLDKLDTNSEDVVSKREKLIKVLEHLFKKIDQPVTQDKIVYEQIIDENNNLYGKDLATGVIFPISKFDNSYRYKIMEKLECYVSRDKAFFETHIDQNGYGWVNDVNGELLNVHNWMLNRSNQISYYEKKINHLSFTKKLLPYHDNLVDGKRATLIHEFGIATDLDIEDYLNKFEGFFGKIALKDKKMAYQELARANIFEYEIVPKKEEEVKEVFLLEQDSFSKQMESIEYLLLKLKKVDKDEYHKYKVEYDNLLNSSCDSLNINPLTISSLVTLEANIEFTLRFGKSTSIEDILNDLDKIKQEYLENIMSNSDEKTKLTIGDLDKISELFLNIKDKYQLKDRRNVLKNIAFLYLMEVYENRDTITLKELNCSYFKNNLKTIMMNIEAMIELGIIDSSIYIDLNHEPTLENVFFIIQNIKFIQTEKDIKKLIKELN